MLTEEAFITAGYKRYEQKHKSCDYMLQKRIDDEHGKKYYIDIYVYDWRKYKDVNPALQDFTFSPEVQFRAFEEGKMTMNVSLLAYADEHTIEVIEKEFEDMWLFLEKPYYRRWEE